MNKYHIPNLGKACEVMKQIADHPGGIALKEISQSLEIPRTTALRITQTLLEDGFLAETDNGTLTLGPTLVQVGVKALDNLDIRGFARPVLRKLAEETGESCHLAVLNGDKSMLVEVADSPHPVRIAARPGTLVDLHSSSTGKIFLAFQIPEPSRFIRTLNLTAYTAQTNSTEAMVLADIEQTRKLGYAMDEEEYVPGVRCIAAPVINAFGKTIAAAGITASVSTFTKAKIRGMSQKIKAAASEISANMGFG
ncbi:IclR family transcriptional regulator [Pontiella agarivorans]|uniref:IclR family transcriptional regulator n=1 Tax=Pontiella agarivorans TaxID=3038953 RepID=A0ABU5MYA1_9BACT|nr:IclR family transcriptional regulator [Pontiella agarivorans]MDZ8119165.1 IclR family transcriptional regulator [Pontiella agarivorans]